MKRIIFTAFLAFSILHCFAQSEQIHKDKELTLVLFLLDDCPICIDYTVTLNDLHSQYSDQVDFIGYFPNFTSKPEKIAKFKKQFSIQFPLKTDFYKKVVKKYNAEVTPEVILIDNNSNKIVYRGRIDNKFFKLGRRRNVVTEHNLKDAIDNFLSGRPIEQGSTLPIGCFISFNDKIDGN